MIQILLSISIDIENGVIRYAELSYGFLAPLAFWQLRGFFCFDLLNREGARDAKGSGYLEFQSGIINAASAARNGYVRFQWYSFRKSDISAYSEVLNYLVYSAPPITISFSWRPSRLRGSMFRVSLRPSRLRGSMFRFSLRT
jgi:hypothetical protein